MPATTPWYQGAQVPLAFLLTDTSGNPQNAGSLSSVTCTVTQPDGTTATPAVSLASTGNYEATFTSAQAGHHLVLWLSTDSTYPGAFADTFEVQPQQDPTIVSLAEAKSILHMTSTTEFDAVIQGYNAAATNWVEYVCGPVVQQTVIETIPARGTETILSKPPILELLPWTVLPAELANLGITLPSPESPMIRTRVYGIEWPLTQLYCDLRRGIVTHTSGLPFYYCAYIWQYQAGRQIIPAGIYEATKITLEHLFQVERGGAGSADSSAGESGTTMTGFGFAVPNRALQLLAPYSSPSRMVAA
jgi:hypothetical protein